MARTCINPRHTQHGAPEGKLGAINVQLTSPDLREIETAFSKISVLGERMSEKHMQQIDQT